MRRKSVAWAVWLNLAGVLVAFSLVWRPELAAHWATPLLVPVAAVEQGRQVPSSSLLEEIGKQSLGLPLVPDTVTRSRNAAIIESASRYLEGNVLFPGQPRVPLSVPFQASNLTAGPPTHQLYVASLATADTWLKAYRLTGDERYFTAARNEIAAYARTDRWRLIPAGMLWNDHALAATIPVLADYWSLLRSRADFDPAHAREVLSLVRRTATRLAKAQNYTFRTNHGLMQSLALLQTAAAFPYLEPHGVDLRKLACERIVEQTDYYLSPEGPVLEHSAGYHILGLYLYTILKELGSSHGCEMPASFALKFERARAFAAQLRRPDGSLPDIGNTDLSERVPASLIGDSSIEKTTSAVYPVSGFAVWWYHQTRESIPPWSAQTALTWSNYPSGAHKLADDMSLVIWADDHDWLINTGYWPYGAPAAAAAHGWRGSNAPHWQGESPRNSRKNKLVSYGNNDRLWWIELERSSGEYPTRSLRRQVAAVDGRWWVIVDSSESGDESPRSVVWTVAPGLQVRKDGRGFSIGRNANEQVANLRILEAGGESKVRLMKGEVNPFGGWAVSSGIPTPTWAIETTTSGTQFTVFSVHNERVSEGEGHRVGPGAVPDDWTVFLHGQKDHAAFDLQWDGQRLRARFADGATEVIEPALAPLADVDTRRATIVHAYMAAKAQHQRIPNLLGYRFKVSKAMLGLVAVQEIVLLAVKRWQRQATEGLRVLAAIGWLVLGYFAAFVYLVR